MNHVYPINWYSDQEPYSQEVRVSSVSSHSSSDGMPMCRRMTGNQKFLGVNYGFTHDSPEMAPGFDNR